MRNRRITIAIVGLAAAAIGGVTVAATAGGSAYKPSSVSAKSHSSGGSTSSGPSPAPALRPPTIHTTQATVGGRSETILVNQADLPLYIYRPDTASQSFVGGALAAAWPPLVGTAPTTSGATGTVGVVDTANGHQVTYNGHFLYTFVQDRPGEVTGQGVQNFFVATPDVGPISGMTASTAMPPEPSTTPAPATRTPVPATPAPAHRGWSY